MRTKELGSGRNGHAEALGARPQATTFAQVETNAQAAVTALALGYEAEAKRRVQMGMTPFTLAGYLADRCAEVAAQVRALGASERVGA